MKGGHSHCTFNMPYKIQPLGIVLLPKPQMQQLVRLERRKGCMLVRERFHVQLRLAWLQFILLVLLGFFGFGGARFTLGLGFHFLVV